MQAKLLKEVLEWDVKYLKGLVPFILGEQGIGKSHIVAQIAAGYHQMNPVAKPDIFNIHHKAEIVQRIYDDIMTDVPNPEADKQVGKAVIKAIEKHMDPQDIMSGNAKRMALDIQRSMNPGADVASDDKIIKLSQHLSPLANELKDRRNLPVRMPPFTANVPGLMGFTMNNKGSGSPGNVDLRLATMEPGDLIGYPQQQQIVNLDGSVGYITKWAEPGWWPHSSWGNTLLFLDELNRADRQTTQAIFQLIYDRRLGTHVLPDTVKIVAAGNPPTARYDVNEEDKALEGRMCYLTYEADLQGFLEYGRDNLDPAVLQYVIEQPQNLLNGEVQRYTPEVEPCPRKWAMASEVLTSRDENGKPCPQNVRSELMMGLLGEIVGASFSNFLVDPSPRALKAEEIFDAERFPAEQLSQQVNTPDRMFFTGMMVSKYLKEKRKKDQRNSHVDRFDKLVSNLKPDQAYNLIFSIVENGGPSSSQDSDPSLGYHLISTTNCKETLEIITRIMEERKDYDSTARAA